MLINPLLPISYKNSGLCLGMFINWLIKNHNYYIGLNK